MTKEYGTHPAVRAKASFVVSLSLINANRTILLCQSTIVVEQRESA